MLSASEATWAQTSNYFNGFEIGVGPDDWVDVTRVSSGTNGITSATGSFHARQGALGGFTRLGHVGGGSYNFVFPCNGYKTSLDIYLDINGGYANDTRVDYSSAINGSNGLHRRDFSFAIGFYIDAIAPGAGNRFVVSASNNTPGWPKNPGRSPQVISTSGWYKFEHSFRNNGGVLAVDLTIYDAANTPVATWTLSDPSDLMSIIGGSRYGWVLNNAFSLLPIDNSALVLNPVLGPVHNLTTGLNYCTIQAAIDDPLTISGAGHIISVDPGTYNEAVTINKSIQLQGQPGQVLNTIIKAPATLPLPATQNSNIVTVTGAGISAEINDLTIAGPGPSGCGSISYGIFVRSGAFANIHDNRIIDVRDNPFGGCQNGVAIQVGRQAFGTTGTATITNNIITGYQKNGITVDNVGSNATLSGNTITGVGTTAIIAQNGIQISRGATGTLSNNTINGNSYHNVGNPSDWGSTGILLYLNGAVSLNGGNNLTGNDQNLYVLTPSGIITIGAEIFGSSSAPLGTGNQIVNIGSQNLDARSSTFGGLAPGAMNMTQLFNLEDYIFHKIDNPEEGFVYVKTNNDYVTINSFDAASGYPDAQIQRGIDAASNGFTVNVQSGAYAKQIATNRSVFGVNGPHQFGLFVDKDNLTIKGYDAADAPVANASAAAVSFTTGATNNFGSSGIFVQANGVTLEGLKIGNNLNNANVKSNNKTIEIVGDAFTLNKCWINTASNEGAVYMGRWDATHPISSYALTQNKFENTLVSINNGAGLTGSRAGRLITNNEFVGIATPYLIGFRGWNGGAPVQGWIVNPVGGAVITGNLFNTTGVDKYVVARGNAGGYVNGEFDWAEIWNMNTYGNHVVTLTDYPTFDVRTYVDGTGYPESRRISPMIQENVNIGNTGDVVLVSAGTFNESVNINKSVKLRGVQADNCAATRTGTESIINCVNGIGVNASNVTINGFTIQGQTAVNSAPGFGYAIYMAPPNTGTQVLNNIIKNNVIGSSVSNAGVSPAQVLISCNWFDANNNAGAAGGSGIYTDEFVSGGVISNVMIDGNKFTGHINDGGIDFSITQSAKAATGITITNNVFDGNRRAAFLDHVVSSSFSNNEIQHSTGTGTGELRIYGGVNNLNVTNNKFNGGALTPHAIRITNEGGDDNSTITVFENSFEGYSIANTAIEIVSGYPGGPLPATCNWYGTTDYVTVSSKVAGNINYTPYLMDGTDNLPGTTGFQPVPGSCNGPLPTISFTASTTSGSSAATTNSSPNSLTINFCVGSSFTFSGYSSIPGSGVGILESLVSSGNVKNNGNVVPLAEGPTEIFPDQIASYFSDTYGPYTLASGTIGTIDQTYTPYYDVNNDNNYDAGIDIPGTPIVLHYYIDGKAPVLINPLVGCSSLNQIELNQCLSVAEGFDGETLVAAIAALFQDDLSSVTVTFTDAVPDEVNTNCAWGFTYNYKIADACGNFVICEVRYSGGDKTAPVLKPNSVIPSGSTGMDACSAPAGPTASEIAALYEDACGGAITVVKTGTPSPSGVCGWSVTYHYTIADLCGNYTTPLEITFSGSDKTPPVITTCPPTRVFCFTGQNQSVPPLVATDNCSSVTVSYVITGATTRSGTGNNATGLFNTGNSTIQWTVKDVCGNTTSCSTSIIVKTSSVEPAAATTSNNNFCPGGSTTLGITGGTLGSDADWYWYSGSCGGTPVGSGPSIVVSPTVTTTYYVRPEGACPCTVCKSVTVTVKTLSVAPTAATSSNANFCIGGSTTLGITGGSLGTGASWKWYTGSCGGTAVGTGATLVVSPNTTTTYYVRADGNCNTTTCASVTVTVRTLSLAPTSATTNKNNICPGESATLTVNGGSLGNASVWKWYSGSCGATLVGTGSTILVSPVVTSTYYVRAEGCNTTTDVNVTITVKKESVAANTATASSNNFCRGGSTTLGITGGVLGTGASWKWYSGSCGGTLVGTGASISVTPLVSTTYFVRAEGDCNTTICKSVVVTVKTMSVAATSATTNNTNLCPGGSATLGITGGVLGTGASWKWYSVSCGGTLVGTGPSIVVSPAVTTTYFVRAAGDCNTTTCVSVKVTVKEKPSVTITQSNLPNVCQGSAVTFTANASIGVTYLWSPGGATTSSISVSAPGTYSVTVTNGVGCTATSSINLVSGNVLSNYTILVKTNAYIELLSNVQTGGVGSISTYSGDKIWVNDISTITGPGTFAMAQNIVVEAGSSVTNQVPTSSLAVFPVFVNNPSPSSGNNVTVADNATVTLAGSLYKEILVGKNATVIFTAAIVNIRKLTTNDNSTVKFSGNCEWRVFYPMIIGTNNQFNPDLKNVFVYAKDYVSISGGSTVNASIYSLKSIDPIGTNVKRITMKGLFLAQDVHSHYATWNGQACTPPVAPPAQSASFVNNSRGTKNPIVVTDEEFNVHIYPNPSTTDFRIQVKSSSEAPVSIRIFDVTGRTIKVINNVSANSYINVGSELRQGSYFAEVLQGDKRQTIKLLKME